MFPQYLYRGYNCTISLQQALIAKAPHCPLETAPECGDDRVQCGDIDFQSGFSPMNTLHSHEYGGSGASTCLLSTTPNFEMAKKYALHVNRFAAGTVIKISTVELVKHGVQIFPVSFLEQPSVPEDDEHAIYVNNGKFPLSSISELIYVLRD